jgi:dGTP triphosphohydrolase
MRTQKEIARYVEAGFIKERVKPTRTHKKAYIAICSVREIQHDIALELEDIKKGTSNLINRLDVLEEKIRLAPEDANQKMIEWGKEIKKIAGQLEDHNFDFDDFSVMDYLLTKLEGSMNGFRRRKNWVEINKIAKELKLAKLIKSNKAATEIGDFLKRSLEKRYEVNLITHEAGESFEQERERLKKIFAEARNLVPRPETTEEDIIRRIREKSVGTTHATAATTTTIDDGNLTANFA